jgi:hypothetical protein
MVSATVACLPAAVSLLLLEALFVQISRVSLALTWPCRLCLFTFLLCLSLCYKLSPFQALGKVTLHPRCQACVFIYSSCGRWVFPPLLCSSPTSAFTSFPAPDYWVVLLLLPAAMFVNSSCGKWVFPPLQREFSSLCHCHKLSRSWLPGAHPRSHQRLSGLPGLFIYSPRKDSLPPIFGAQCAPPSFLCVLFVLIAYYSNSLFSQGGGQSVQWPMLLWPRLVCGSTAVLQSSPGPHLPKPSGRQCLVARGPSWFLCLT